MDILLSSLFAFDDVATVGDRLAIDFRIGPRSAHRAVTFAALRHAVLMRARTFDRCRIGGRIALLMPPGEALVTAFFAAIYCGLVPSILAWPTAKMDREKYRRNILAVVRALAADYLVTDATTASSLGEVLGSTRVIDIGATAESDDDGPPARVRANGTAFIQFSGGTTGVQKSVPIPFVKLGQQIDTLAAAIELNGADHVISWLPLYHDMGLVACLMLPFLKRIPVTMFAPMEWIIDPEPFLAAIGEQRATLCWLPNFAFSFLASRAKLPHRLDLSSMRAFVNCSEPVRGESFDAFLARFSSHGLAPAALHASYAMAEATFAVTQTTAVHPPRRLEVSREALSEGWLKPEFGNGRVLVSSGRALDGVELRVMASGSHSCAPGQVGEIWLRGPFVMDDYLDPERRPGGPRQDFTEGFYRSGDLGALIDGELFVTGRKKDLIIIGGINIFPEDVESAVGEVERIHAGRVVALGIDSAELATERLLVVAETDSEDDLADAKSIEIEIRKAVVAVCGVAPHRVLVVPPKWIVKSTAGKISRADTRDRVLAHLAGGDSASPGAE